MFPFCPQLFYFGELISFKNIIICMIHLDRAVLQRLFRHIVYLFICCFGDYVEFNKIAERVYGGNLFCFLQLINLILIIKVNKLKAFPDPNQKSVHFFCISVGDRKTCLELLSSEKLKIFFEKVYEVLSEKIKGTFIISAKKRIIKDLLEEIKLENFLEIGFPLLNGRREYFTFSEKEKILLEKLFLFRSELLIQLENCNDEKLLLKFILNVHERVCNEVKIIIDAVEYG